ncbi:MAG: glycosyl transferase, partial [Paludibacteraceae bacterium]|nr:glycosyl transferase [Paludibacteraceae bacterium]
CQMVAGKDAAKPGEGKNSWLTGTAAWMWLTVSQYLLGIKPSYKGLEINPCLPSDMKSYSVNRKFRDADYSITVIPNGVQKGVKKLIVNGKEIAGNVVPMQPAGSKTVVEVIMG